MRVLFFSPHAGIIEHARAERNLARAFRASGWDVTVVGCGGALSNFCNVMTARRFQPADAAVVAGELCRGCQSASQRLFGADSAFDRVELSEVLTRTDWDEIESVVHSASRDSWPSLEFMGLPVGRLAAYEFMLTYKIHDLDLPAERWPEYLGMLRSVLASAVACPRILDSQKPDRVVVYNSLYGVNAVWKRMAEDRGIASYAMQYNILAPRIHDFLMVYRDDSQRCALNHSREAAGALEAPIGDAQVNVVHEALLANLMAANLFVYSGGHQGLDPAMTRERLGLDCARPVILVPLSSEDERFAAGFVGVEIMARQPTLFARQVDFVRHLCLLAARRTDLQFVVRLHPRMFPNRREGVSASAAGEILEVLASAPTNLVVNTPAQDVSLMDVAQVTMVCLAGRSSVGAQLSAFGIPLVVHDGEVLTAFPPTLGIVVSDETELEAGIDHALASPVLISTVVRAYRWLAFAILGVSVDLKAGTTARGAQDRAARMRSSISKAAATVGRIAPVRVQARLKARDIRQRAAAVEELEESELACYDQLVRVIADQRDHLAAGGTTLEVEPGEEEAAVRRSTASLLAVLGEYEDPTCLSSRLKNLLAT